MNSDHKKVSYHHGMSVLVRAMAALGALAISARVLRHASSRDPDLHSRIATEADSDLFGRHLPNPSIAAGKVIGSFDDEHIALDTVKALVNRWPAKLEVYSPNLNEEMIAAMRLPKSPVRFWIAAGAVFGQLGGWVTTIMLSIYWRHPVAGMPVIAVPPFAIIAFEMMVLLGAVAGMLGLFFHCRLPNLTPSPEYLDRFKQDRIGIVLECSEHGQIVRAARTLRSHGASEIVYV
jgi:hypothetical protein